MKTKLAELKEKFLAMLNELDETNPYAIWLAPKEWKDRLVILHEEIISVGEQKHNEEV
jgi:hypothetical protein